MVIFDNDQEYWQKLASYELVSGEYRLCIKEVGKEDLDFSLPKVFLVAIQNKDIINSHLDDLFEVLMKMKEAKVIVYCFPKEASKGLLEMAYSLIDKEGLEIVGSSLKLNMLFNLINQIPKDLEMLHWEELRKNRK